MIKERLNQSLGIKDGRVMQTILSIFLFFVFMLSTLDGAYQLRYYAQFIPGISDEVSFITEVGTRIVGCVEAFHSDIWTLFDKRRVPYSDVVIVAIDQKSYDLMGITHNRPFPRKYFAQLFRILGEQGVRIVALDAHIEGDTPDDEELVNAIRGVPTILGYGNFGDGRIYTNEKKFVDAAFGLGSMMIRDDYDRRVRRFPPQISESGALYRGLAQVAVDKYISLSLVNQENSKDKRRIYQGSDSTMIRFYGPGKIRSIAAHSLLLDPDNAKLQALRGKLVFLGFTRNIFKHEPGLDSYPIGGFYGFGEQKSRFGLEIQATIASNILSNDMIEQLPVPYLTIGAGLFLLWSLLVISLDSYRGIVWNVVGLGIWEFATYICFLEGILLSGAVAMWLLFFIRIWKSMPDFYESFRQKERLRTELERFLPPALVGKCLRTGMSGVGVGEILPAVVMFTDIKSFSQLVNRISPSALVPLLNKYFQGIYDIVFESQGTIMRFTGDGVIISWGAPFPNSDDAEYALKAAMKIQERVRSLPLPIETRIGVAFGPVIAGYIGANTRADYTLIGEAVILAARLESLNKQLGTECLFTEEVVKRCKNIEALIYLGRFRVVGASGAKGLYTTLSSTMNDEFCQKWRGFINSFEAHEDGIMEQFRLLSSTMEGLQLFKDFFDWQLLDDRVLRDREFYCVQK